MIGISGYGGIATCLEQQTALLWHADLAYVYMVNPDKSNIVA
jgi:hypothetical protein